MKKRTFVRFYLALAFIVLIVMVYEGCSSTDPEDAKPSPFTHGNVQLNLKAQITTQAEVLEKFGPPNIAATDASGSEIWTYQKNATVTREAGKGGYFTIVLLGAQSGSSGFEQSQKAMTLIIKFGKDKKVADFKSMSSSF
ncbi:MAG: hypothetical protein A2017_07300 [Lentisphaerae bacterium GWF2_44_16]|nr:MAG: hypothetical protein A2017_07300 [Lentisphaerae bacterium GWF2_44_16]